MNKSQKVNILYQMAMGQRVELSPAQRKELSRYKVSGVGKPLTTKSNISEYVTAVDKGCHKGFYDWCMDHKKGDRRTKMGQKEYLKQFDGAKSFGVLILGWFTWGAAIYWLLDTRLAVGPCIVLGAIAALVIYRLKREWVLFTLFVLPSIIMAICITYR